MRTSIVVWSTLSGAVLGVLADVALTGVLLLLTLAAPASMERLAHERWVVAFAAVMLFAVLVAGGTLGYLEGQLKAV